MNIETFELQIIYIISKQEKPKQIVKPVPNALNYIWQASEVICAPKVITIENTIA